MTKPRQKIQKIIDFTLDQEGLYQCDRSDPGNWTGGVPGNGNLVGTKYGISAPVLQNMRGRQYRLTANDMRLLTQDEARSIAIAQYWAVMCCDELPAGIDCMVFDYGFNAGCQASVMLLQRSAGITQDGLVGPKTLASVTTVPVDKLAVFLSSATLTALQKWGDLPQTGKLDAKTLEALDECDRHLTIFCAALAELQLGQYRKMSGFPRFGKGWTNRVMARFDFACTLIHDNDLAPDC